GQGRVHHNGLHAGPSLRRMSPASVSNNVSHSMIDVMRLLSDRCRLARPASRSSPIGPRPAFSATRDARFREVRRAASNDRNVLTESETPAPDPTPPLFSRLGTMPQICLAPFSLRVGAATCG